MVLKRITRSIVRKLRAFQNSDRKYLWILIALSLLIWLSPYLPSQGLGAYVFSILVSFIILSSILAGSNDVHVVGQIVAIGVISLILNIIQTVRLEASSQPRIFTTIFYTVFFIFVTVITIIQVVKSPTVTGNTICGAIVGYLLIGLSATFVATVMETIYPGVFLMQGELIRDGEIFTSLLYYCFVTLATVGYGDILPNVPLAESFAVAIGVIGQFYLTVLVAMLVGKYIQNA